MSNCKIPHIRLPRSLLQDPLWIELPLSYQHIYLVIIEKILYKPKTFDDHGVLLDLKKGQICITERELLKFCHKSISKNEIHRSIVKLKLYGFLNQEVIHTKNVLTITHKDTYDLINGYKEPESEPGLNQDRTRIEPEKEKEEKEEKEENIISLLSASEKVIGSDFSLENSQEKKPDITYIIKPTTNSSELVSDTNKTPQKTRKSKQKPIIPDGKEFGTYVRLREETYTKYCEEHGKDKTDGIIQSINDHCTNNRRDGYTDYEAAFRTFLNNYKSRSPPNSQNNSNSNTSDLRRVKDINGNPIKNPHEGSF